MLIHERCGVLLGSSGFWSDAVQKRKTAEQIVYLPVSDLSIVAN